jgi:hypothetical protein
MSEEQLQNMLDQGVSALLITFLNNASQAVCGSVMWVMDNMAQDQGPARKRLLEDGVLSELVKVSF